MTVDLTTSINDARQTLADERRKHWIGGVPTQADLAAIDRQVARDLKLDLIAVRQVPSRLPRAVA